MAQLREFGQGLIDPTFCCCAVPTVNAGIYSILLEQLLLGVGVGVAAIITDDIVGAQVPSFSIYIFAICCWAVAVCQPLGFIGVMREKTKTFKVYSLINALCFAAAFSTAAALIITSALRHDTAVANCELAYFSTANTSSSMANDMLQNEGPILCTPFAWADVGVMGGLWMLLLLLQGYFIYITRKYSFSQVSDHKLYHSVYSENPEAFTMSVLRSSKYNPGSIYNAQAPVGPHADAWDARPSMDSQRGESYGYGDAYGDGGYNYGPGGVGYNHSRVESYASEGRYEDAYGDGGRGYDQNQYSQHGAYGSQHDAYPPQYPEQHYPFAQQGQGYIDHPADAHPGRDPGMTPTQRSYEFDQGQYAGNGGLRRPEDVQNHPAEGMFGRKSPRR